MPKYLFRCTETGEEKELVISPIPYGRLPEEWKTETVDGHTHTWKRVFTPPGIIFRGSGWAGKS